MQLPTTLQGRPFGPEPLAQIQALIEQNRGWSRYQLSRELARLWDWRTPRGQLNDMAARTLLLKLQERGWIELPVRRMLSPTRSGRAPAGGPPLLEPGPNYPACPNVGLPSPPLLGHAPVGSAVHL